MVFSSPVFLFGFLPLTLLVYFLSPKATKNIILLFASLLFYAWGEVLYVGVMVASILANYVFGRLIYGAQVHPEQVSANPSRASFFSPGNYLALGVVINVGLLTGFKYTTFIAENANRVLSAIGFPTINIAPIHLPLGISFFTFQAISYLVDVYRKDVQAQKNLLHLAIYISLFPQLIAGPIVRYSDVAQQMLRRTHSSALFASGVQRFIMGLSKKMLIANPLGEVADAVFSLSADDLTGPLAWIGILAYTLQIYFDFSGYSDMAIGLGRLFGFQFLENFNYPYISRSLREFWHRWHISLSTWFRDCIYIPLGGSRVSNFRIYLNLLAVFLLTGVWHGASWNFIFWGLFHGFFIAAERTSFSGALYRLWQPFQHLYALLVVITAWVLFRADTLSYATDYLKAMVNITNWQTTPFQYAQVVSFESFYIFGIGVVLSLPIYSWLKRCLARVSRRGAEKVAAFIYVPKLMFLSCLLLLSLFEVSAATYNPFIYFRF